MQRFVWAAAAVLAVTVATSAAISSSETARLAAAARVVHDIQATIPQDYWNRARCVIVIPELKKAAFILGAEYGKGVMSCRSGERWSAPVFMQLAKGSWGFQAGAEQVDVVMLVTNEQGVQKLLENKVNLGVDASVAAGPLGRQAQAGTDAALKAEILSYSRASGLFAGIDLSGGVLRPDEDANHHAYGASATARTILASSGISAPTEATAFLNALGSVHGGAAERPAATTGTSPKASAVPAQPATTVPSTTDSDIRVRAIDIQQTVERMLMDAPPAPVGTSGSSGASVVVDRAKLLQLRQQVDALIASINQRG
jgi:lipid-binding SYLF domain-containing protein